MIQEITISICTCEMDYKVSTSAMQDILFFFFFFFLTNSSNEQSFA